MNSNYLLLGISACFLAGIVARESIVGGEKAAFPECLYHVMILVADQAPRCGGGILDNHFVLTAAHCVIGLNYQLHGRSISVLAKTYDLEIAGVVIEVQKITVPLEYNPHDVNPTADIAMLKLRRPLEVMRLGLKKLYISSDKRGVSYDYKTVRIAGFGWDRIYDNNELIGEHSDNRLRLAAATVRTIDECHNDHPNRNISESQLCARVQPVTNLTNRRGVCIGDGGGSLVYNGKIVIGVLSISTIGCSEQSSSGIYTRVSSYRNFIVNTLHNKISSQERTFHINY